MGSIACWLIPFLIGVIVGWLLNWLFSRMMHKDEPAPLADVAPAPTPAPVAAPKPVAATPAAPAPAPAPPAPKPAARVAAAVATAAAVDLAAARAAGFTMKGVDDLTIIEGVGPKINELMKAHGVKTFADVAKSSVPNLQKVLDAGGPHFRLANPETWPHQAQMAADNRWSALKAFQEQMGRRTGGPAKS